MVVFKVYAVYRFTSVNGFIIPHRKIFGFCWSRNGHMMFDKKVLVLIFNVHSRLFHSCYLSSRVLLLLLVRNLNGRTFVIGPLSMFKLGDLKYGSERCFFYRHVVFNSESRREYYFCQHVLSVY